MTGFIRQQLMAAAARSGNYGRAHLLRLHLSPPPTDALPSLEAFVSEEDLADFSEAEQQAVFEERFGSVLTAQRRRAGLLRRQLLAVHMLEAQLCAPVSPYDGCEVWFVDAIAQRLALHGMTRLGELRARMAAAPEDWWHGLKGIGAGKAAALHRFVAAHAGTLGVLPARDPDLAAEDSAEPAAMASASAGPTVSPLVPLERLCLPDDLSGRLGRFRGATESCLLEADNDLAAIHAFLSTRAPANEDGRHTATYLAYRKEAERFLLWAVFERHKPLSSCTVEDCSAFRDFLLAPPAHWCAPRSIARWHAGWRPIEGPLSPASCAYALGVLHNLATFLQQHGYLQGNPWAGVQMPRFAQGTPRGRALSEAQWRVVRDTAATLPLTLANRRLRAALRLMYEAGLRLAEVVAARTDDLAWRELVYPGAPVQAGWWLTVIGKGRRMRELPLSEGWVREFGDYLMARGLPSDLQKVPDVPLLGSASRDASPADGVSANVFHAALKVFFARCAATLEASDPQGAAQLRAATSHWLRHTHVSHSIDGGVPVQVAQANAGHASLHTTTRYVTTEDVRRAQALSAWWASSAPPAAVPPEETDP